MSKLQAIRGMHDILPQESSLWQSVENTVKAIANSFAFREIRFPMVEKTSLFKRTIGEVTDIIEKEMYTFEDKNGDHLSLRPEGTASCIRAGLEHSLFYNQTQKLWYLGPFFRHERPQKGRCRQFHQFGVEAVGIASADIDAEVIALSATIFSRFQLNHHVQLRINSMGNLHSRNQYKTVLQTYLRDHFDALDEDSKRRLETNPLRILDSKNPALYDIIQRAPKLIDHIDADSRSHFSEVKRYLEALEIPYIEDPTIVRGLDYYTQTVFEWVTDALGAQGTVCAGGRYDGLVEQLGGKPTPAIGFALGIERLLELIKQQRSVQAKAPAECYVMVTGQTALAPALRMVQQLRQALPYTVIYQNCGQQSLKNQLKKADKSGAAFGIIIGEEEVEQQRYTVKNLRQHQMQQSLTLTELIDFIDSK